MMADGEPLLTDVMNRVLIPFMLTKGVSRPLVPGWLLDLVLAALKWQPFEPIRLASLKYQYLA